ncbi:MAG: bifunctional heptose 7-phosphate kinase/heptose 1-phosphate adenyltransferase, partial [Parachlamydiaceae bacterium]
MSKKVLLLGDLMLDSYTFGKVKRISPEAPVPILHAGKEEELPGGAGNVALNLRSLGCEVVLCGRVGDDKAAHTLKQKFYDEKVEFIPVVEKNYRTPIKHRLIADNQQLIRIDYEEISFLPDELIAPALKTLEEKIAQVDIVALSDYGKGFLTSAFCKSVIALAKKHKKKIIVDPKGLDYSKYCGVDLIKPNRKEAYDASHLPQTEPIQHAAKKLLEITRAESIVITLSEEGMVLFQKGSEKKFPVKSKEVKDVTGAGDTVLASLVAALASNLTLDEAIKLANVSASIAIEQVGCARVSLKDLARRLLEIDHHNKVFDENHLFALSHALKDQPYHVMKLDPNTTISPELFQSIRK